MAMEAQLQIRQNAMEVQDYLSDLFDWQKTIKQKESKATGRLATHSVPGPRGRANTTVSEAPRELQTPAIGQKAPAGSSKPVSKATGSTPAPDTAANAAAHTHSSYSKWDKIDVDAMLNSDDEEESNQQPADTAKPHPRTQTTSTTTTTTAPAMSKVSPVPNQLPTTSSVQIHAGTSATDIVATSTRRTTPVDSLPSTSTPTASVPAPRQPPVRNSEPQTADAWRMRGNDLFKAQQYAYAKDCYARCIELDPSSAVAYANRAMAELKLSQWKEAVEDCTKALERDPTFVKALHRRGTARRQLGQLLLAAQDFEDAMRWEPTNKSLAADRDAALAAYTAESQVPPLMNRTRLPVTLVQHVHVQQQQQQQQKPAPVAARAPGMPVGADVQGSDGGVEKGSEVGGQSLSARSSGSGAAEGAAVGSKARLAAAVAGAAEQLASRAAAQVKHPRTSTEFEATWRSLTGDASAQLGYLKIITPGQLPGIFKSSLTPQLLSSILEVVLAGVAAGLQGETGTQAAVWDVQGALAFLQGLSKVPRLEMAAMCIGGAKKAELRAAWERVFFVGTQEEQASKSVRAAFKL